MVLIIQTGYMLLLCQETVRHKFGEEQLDQMQEQNLFDLGKIDACDLKLKEHPNVE